MYLHCIFAAQSFGSSPSSEGGELNAYPTAYSSELTLRRKVRLNLKTGLENGDLPQYTWPQKVFSKVSRTVKVCHAFVKTFLRPSSYEISSTSNPVFRLNAYAVVLLLFFALARPSLLATETAWHIVDSREIGSYVNQQPATNNQQFLFQPAIAIRSGYRIDESAVFLSISLSRTKGGGDSENVHLEGVVFKDQFFRLEVVDNSMREKTLSQAMQEGHFLAGVNGGYFQPNGTPLGLVVHQKKILHSQEKARLLSGFLITEDHRMTLTRVGEKIPEGAIEVLQAGPFLIDHEMPVVGLEDQRVARRTFLATDGRGLWVMGIISPVTLADASRVLLVASPKLFLTGKIQRALNLDGGSSSALWVNFQSDPFSQSEWGTVRNFLGLRTCVSSKRN
ncbi:MAG: hypothetical protein A3F67_09455 [Verrucomicrobia bacterium RIFCSPHIGHO2_12_FULL_41_10]|nr:MAG: hypothetical protein A3F67_09455 [Verrucomicrobia bacterium RIFCSPHIGHO2_12_FULL_41_10]HLB34733.1 phosphodiester glycosidase family protein [Chthoniobacterales bacterium]